jgi:hypothetical protein
MTLLAIKPGEETRSAGDNVLARLDAVRQNPGPLRSPSSPS